MSLALLTLVGFQFYWIKGAVDENHASFEKEVREALNAVVLQLEKHEAFSTIYPTINPTIGLLPKAAQAQQEQLLFSFQFEINDGLGNNQVIQFQNQPPQDWVGQIPASSAQEEMERMMLENQQRLQAKSQTINNLFQELFTRNQNISNRVNQLQLDSILKKELTKRGIEIEADYAILDSEKKQLVLSNAKDPQQAQVIQESGFKVSLYPNDLFNRNNYLLVNFPQQQKYLFGKVILPLGSSIILIVIIVLSFGYALITIINQKKLSEIKNDFINNMTHEFKTPISTVSLATQALQEPEIAANPRIQSRYLQIIREENNRLGLQVEKVLQISRLDARDFELKMELVSVHETIEKVLSSLALQVEQNEGMVMKKMGALEDHIQADELHLHNILYNLVDNAIKYSPERPAVTVRTMNATRGIVINVVDQGVGIGSEAIGKIFDKFYRIPTGNLHNVKGFGLGLAYVKVLVEAHGGNIKVSSELNKGSNFEIYLPYEQGAS